MCANSLVEETITLDFIRRRSDGEFGSKMTAPQVVTQAFDKRLIL